MDEVVARIEAVRRDPARRGELVELLRDSHPLHRGLGGAEVVRLRAFVMQSFGEVGMPDEAVPFVLEDLEMSDHAEALAAAARALRGWKAAPALIPLLEAAAARARDDYVSFAGYDAVGSPRAGKSAKRELEETAAWVRGNLDCCAVLPGLVRKVDAESRASAGEVAGLTLEDQDGARVRFGELFLGSPAVVAFFYTRCENPLKCSLTITKLARMQARLAEVVVAGITYDPAFDTPARLRAYGIARGFRPSPRHRLLRPASFEPLAGFFGSDVSRAGATVTRHRVELYVLDAEARIAAAYEHRSWDEDAVVELAVSADLLGG